MNWPHFIVLIITEIRGGSERHGGSLAHHLPVLRGLWCMFCRVLWHCLVEVIFRGSVHPCSLASPSYEGQSPCSVLPSANSFLQVEVKCSWEVRCHIAVVFLKLWFMDTVSGA